jgi:glycosyltransferase involved in cell wall biosynthesis
MAQAMMSGASVVASRSGAIPEVLGEAGVLVPENDVEALATALREILTDEARRADLGRLARQRAVEQFSPEVVGSGYLRALAGTSESRSGVP